MSQQLPSSSNRWSTVALSSPNPGEHNLPYRETSRITSINIQSQNPQFLSGWPCWILLLNDVTACHQRCSERATRTPVPGGKLYLRSSWWLISLAAFMLPFTATGAFVAHHRARCVFVTVNQMKWKEVPFWESYFFRLSFFCMSRQESV